MHNALCVMSDGNLSNDAFIRIGHCEISLSSFTHCLQLYDPAVSALALEIVEAA